MTEQNIKSIAFPSIGRGKFYPSEEIAQVSLQSVYKFLEQNKDKNLEVKFVSPKYHYDTIQVK